MPKPPSKNYRPRAYMNRVLSEAPVSNGAARVLASICWFAEFDRPESTFTVNQIAKHARYHPDTVSGHLKELRAARVIVPIQHFEGGRGRAVTYSLHALGQGGSEATSSTGQGKSLGDRITEIMREERTDYATARRMAISEGYE